MSQSDSFIEEVTEEVRRDRLYALARRYGWIAALALACIIGAVAWSEWRSAEATAAAEATGDAILSALEQSEGRAEALGAISDAGAAQVAVDMLRAAELAQAGDVPGAVALYEGIEANNDLPLIYRQIASFKSLTVQTGMLDAAARREGFTALAVPGVALRPLAEEQLALIDIETGAPEAAIERLSALLGDVEATQDLQQRALQVIVALGGEPDLSALTGAAN